MLPNGVLATIHRLVNIKLNSTQTAIEAQVGSWISMSSLASDSAAIWNHYIEVPVRNILTGIVTDILSTETFAGGEILLQEFTELDVARNYKWNELKIERNRREYGGFTWDGSIFDSDPQSQSRIQGGVQLAMIATQSNQPFSIDWTLKDNTVRTLDATSMYGVGMALATHVQNLHQISRTLREQLDNATTLQEVGNINWPT